MTRLCALLALLLCWSPAARAASENRLSQIDVLDYRVSIEPDIQNRLLKGSVTIRFLAKADDLSSVEFDCGDLVIEAVREKKTALQFQIEQHHLRISLPPSQANRAREITIDYHGSPKRGIRFFPERQQVYTVFATSQWMVCIDDPSDKATLTIELNLPAEITAVANGKLVSQRALPNNKVASLWEQRVPIPSYIFGFAAGPFQVVSVRNSHVEMRYLFTGYSADEVRRIFRDTTDMLRFFEDRAGVRYADRVYTQVLAAGGVEQEMSSFTALRENYGKQVLANEQDIWLGAHEFAHQWWGNMVTCQDWTDFWLNEGIATFMAAAYLEHRFGRQSYLREIESYRRSYEKVRAAGKEKSLVFPDWKSPTSEDRTLVYDKGAYVLHLLREEMGDEAFWKGLQIFTRRYFGKSVLTPNFTNAMQKASSKPLQSFFAKWIYAAKIGEADE